MINNTSKIQRIGVKEKPSTWEGFISYPKLFKFDPINFWV